MKVTERALIGRIDRRYGDVSVRKCRWDSRWFGDLGRYYAVNHDNVICGQDIDLEGLGREIGALRPNEVLTD